MVRTTGLSLRWGCQETGTHTPNSPKPPSSHSCKTYVHEPEITRKTCNWIHNVMKRLQRLVSWQASCFTGPERPMPRLHHSPGASPTAWLHHKGDGHANLFTVSCFPGLSYGYAGGHLCRRQAQSRASGPVRNTPWLAATKDNRGPALDTTAECRLPLACPTWRHSRLF